METVPNEKFNLTFYYRNFTDNPCSTVACACGWAATIPAFKKAGFKLVEDIISGQYEPWYKQNFASRAVDNFFGLNDEKIFMYLFTAPEYNNPTRCNVIRRLKSFIKAKQKELDRNKK